MITQKDMMTFTALAEIYSSKYFCNARVAGIGEIFVRQKFSAVWYFILIWGVLKSARKPVTLTYMCMYMFLSSLT